MTQPEAIEVLINAAGAAQKAGAFTLGDARYIMNAIEVIRPSTSTSTEPAPLPPENNESVSTEATV